MTNKTPAVMTIEEMGLALNLSRRKAYELIHSKSSPPVIRVGRVFRVPIDGFNQWLADNSEKGAKI